LKLLETSPRNAVILVSNLVTLAPGFVSMITLIEPVGALIISLCKSDDKLLILVVEGEDCADTFRPDVGRPVIRNENTRIAVNIATALLVFFLFGLSMK